MVKQVQPKTVVVYADESGNEPYTEWLETLKDEKPWNVSEPASGGLRVVYMAIVNPLVMGFQN